MDTNPPKLGAWTGDSSGSGAVTRKLVPERALGLAMIKGRSAQEVPVVPSFAWREYFIEPPNELHSVKRRSSVCLNEGISARWW